MTGNRSELVERLWGLHRSGLSYASDKPAVNLLLADLSEGIADAARALAAPNQPLSDSVLERVAKAVSSAAWDEMRRQGFSGGWDHDELGDALARAAIAAIPSAGGVEERLRETLEGIHRLAERCTGISGTRSLHAAMHAISHAASAALGASK